MPIPARIGGYLLPVIFVVNSNREVLDALLEDGRGAVALRDAARAALPLNAMSQAEAEQLGTTDPQLRRSLVRVDTGKANRAPPDAATWIKLESQSLDNGDGFVPADHVGVASLWEGPGIPVGRAGPIPWAEHMAPLPSAIACSGWPVAGQCAGQGLGRQCFRPPWKPICSVPSGVKQPSNRGAVMGTKPLTDKRPIKING